MSPPEEIKAEYKTIFLEESKDQLQDWEECLLSLEKDSSNRGLIDRLFRAVHTLKGSGGFVGFDELQKITHELESSLQEIRDGEAVLTQDIIELLFEGLDLTRRMIETFAEGRVFDENIDDFLKKFKTLKVRQSEVASGAKTDEKKRKESKSLQKESKGRSKRISRKKGKDRKKSGKIYQMEVFIEGPAKEAYLRSFLVENRLESMGRILSTKPPLEELRLSNDKFTYRVVIDSDEDEDSLRKAANVDQVEVRGVKEVSEGSPEEVSEEERGTPTDRKRVSISKGAGADEVVRVPVEKLDAILNLVGELVVQNSGFISTTSQLQNSYGREPLIVDLEEKTEILAKIARDLQDGVMKVRMLPAATVFNRFNRVVRDLAKDRQKKIILEIFGEKTEIDKKVMDRIGEPLVHLIRNAVDHGIESTEERVAFDKDPTGLIRLGAYQEGDHICIEVSDDGKGLDKQKVLQKAVERGLIKKDDTESLSEEKILSMVFLPGLSTAQEVSDISGRGVGLDVVKRTVEEMGGNVRIKSAVSKGTTITISLPLTMAIIPAILVEVAESIFAVPLSSVREIVRTTPSTLKTVGNSKVIRLRDEVLSMVHLEEAINLTKNTSRSDKGLKTPVVIVNYGEKKIGLGVDRLIGNEEIVIKSLSKHYREIDGLIGASILGTGKIALIVDVEAMVRRYYRGEEIGKALGENEMFSINVKEAVPDQEIAINNEKSGPGMNEEQSSDEKTPERDSPVTKAVNESNKEDESEAAIDENPAVNPTFNLLKNHEKVLEEINNNGAIQASISLSQLTNQEIRVSFPETRIVQLSEVAELLGGEEIPVGGIYVKLKGDIIGGIMFVLPMENLLSFSDLLYHRSSGSTKELSEEELSGLVEMGNILSASFINAIADSTELSVGSEVPEISIDMCLSVVDSVLARFNQPGEQILFTEALIFYRETDNVVCYLLMFLEPESMGRLINVLVDKVYEQSRE